MSKIDDGGPAFPTRGEDFIDGPQGRALQSAWGVEPKSGMTLRDYFAGKALQGELASNGPDYSWKTDKASMDSLAEVCYRYADAMLRARGA